MGDGCIRPVLTSKRALGASILADQALSQGLWFTSKGAKALLNDILWYVKTWKRILPEGDLGRPHTVRTQLL